MTFGFLLIYAILLGTCIAGIFGLFLFKEYVKKISSLSVTYSSFFVLIILLSLKNEKMNEVMTIMVSVMVVFTMNILIGIGIARNIAKARERIAQNKDEKIEEEFEEVVE